MTAPTSDPPTSLLLLICWRGTAEVSNLKSHPFEKKRLPRRGTVPAVNFERLSIMSKTYGKLKRVETDAGQLRAFVGRISAPQIISGDILIQAIDPSKIRGQQWPYDVQFRDNKTSPYGSLGGAKIEQKNAQSNPYLRITLSSPILQNKLGGPFYLRAFPSTEEGKTTSGEFQLYDIVWSEQGGSMAAPALGDLSDLDDEIPNFDADAANKEAA